MLTDRGIVLLHDAANSAANGDPVGAGAHIHGGAGLVRRADPMKLLARTAEPFLRPSEPYEKSGQYKEGTTFVEGLITFPRPLALYYGTSGSRVAVAASAR